MTVTSARDQHLGHRTVPTDSFCALVIDPGAAEATTVRSALTSSPAAVFSVLRAPDLDAGLDALRLGDIDVTLVRDHLLDPHTTAAVLAAAGTRPVLAITSDIDPELSTRWIDAGLHDAVPSHPLAANGLGWAVARAIHRTGGQVGATSPLADDPTPGPADTAAAIRRQLADTRSPLAALVDLLDLLASAWDALDDDHKLSMVASIRSYATTLDRLTGELLSAPSPGPQPMERSSSPAASAARPIGLQGAVTRSLEHTGVHASLEIDAGVVVWAIPNQLDRMLNALLARVARRSLPPVHAIATAGGASVRLSISGTGPPEQRRGGWSLLRADPGRSDDPDDGDDVDLDLDGARRLAEDNGGLVGTGEQPGSVWLRLPSAPPDPALT